MDNQIINNLNIILKIQNKIKSKKIYSKLFDLIFNLFKISKTIKKFPNWKFQKEILTPYIIDNNIQIIWDGKKWKNPFNELRLNNTSSANSKLEYLRNYLNKWSSNIYPNVKKTFKGKGIVFGTGGIMYLPSSLATIEILRNKLSCTLPIEIFYGGSEEIPIKCKEYIESNFSDVKCINMCTIDNLYGHPPPAALNPPAGYRGYPVSALALLYSSFEEVIFLDADCTPIKNPEELFDNVNYNKYGCLFWKDAWTNEFQSKIKNEPLAINTQFLDGLGLNKNKLKKYTSESGQIVINKSKCLRELSIAWILNNANVLASYYSKLPRPKGCANPCKKCNCKTLKKCECLGPFSYRYIWGDKDSFEIAFLFCNSYYYQNPSNVQSLWIDSNHTAFLQKNDNSSETLFIHRVGGNKTDDLENIKLGKNYVTGTLLNTNKGIPATGKLNKNEKEWFDLITDISLKYTINFEKLGCSLK